MSVFLCEHLVSSTVLLTVFATVAGITLYVGKVRSPKIQRLVWSAVLLSGVLWFHVPISLPVLPKIPAPVLVEEPPLDIVHTPSGVTPIPEPMFTEDVTPTFTAPETVKAEPPQWTVVPEPAPITEVKTPVSWSTIFVAVWLLGIVVLILRSVAGYIVILRLVNNAIPASGEDEALWRQVLRYENLPSDKIPLLLTENLGPALIRLPRKCAVVLPEESWELLTLDAKRCVLKHELAHYRRNDIFKSGVMRLLALVHWFNPFAWFARYKFEDAAERACDFYAHGASESDVRIYAEALLAIHDQAATQTAAYRLVLGRGVGERNISERVRSLLHFQTLEDSMFKKTLIISLVCVAVVLGAVRFRLVAQQEPADPQQAASQPEEKPNPNLRYDGKTFAQWKDYLANELKPERRVDGLCAVAAFANKGYGKEAAEYAVELMNERNVEFPPVIFYDAKRFDSMLFVAMTTFSATDEMRIMLPHEIPFQWTIPILMKKYENGTEHEKRNARNMILAILYFMNEKPTPPIEVLKPCAQVLRDIYRDPALRKEYAMPNACVMPLIDELPELIEPLKKMALGEETDQDPSVNRNVYNNAFSTPMIAFHILCKAGKNQQYALEVLPKLAEGLLSDDDAKRVNSMKMIHYLYLIRRDPKGFPWDGVYWDGMWGERSTSFYEVASFAALYYDDETGEIFQSILEEAAKKQRVDEFAQMKVAFQQTVRHSHQGAKDALPTSPKERRIDEAFAKALASMSEENRNAVQKKCAEIPGQLIHHLKGDGASYIVPGTGRGMGGGMR